MLELQLYQCSHCWQEHKQQAGAQAVQPMRITGVTVGTGPAVSCSCRHASGASVFILTFIHLFSYGADALGGKLALDRKDPREWAQALRDFQIEENKDFMQAYATILSESADVAVEWLTPRLHGG
jgi:hypothetical protein